MTLKIFFKKNFTISILILLSLIIVINNFFRFFENKALYQFVPWFSNYQGGFTRRGLPGEIFFQIYDLFNIHLGWIVFIFVSILYLLFYFSFFHLIRKIKLDRLIIFVIFSPLAFYFPVLNSKAAGHKEIIFLSLLSVFCLLIPKMKKIHANYFMIFIASFVILSHDGLVFYLTYLVIPFIIFFDFKNYKKLFLNLFPIIIVTCFLTTLIYFFHGTEQHVIDICDSVESFSNQGCKEAGQIAFLKHTIEYNIFSRGSAEIEGTFVYQEYFKIYSIGFIFGFFPLIILYGKSKFHLREDGVKIYPPLLLFLPLIISFPIYYIAADWGRYLYISYMSSLIIILFCLGNKILIIEKKEVIFSENIIKKFLFVIIIVIYCLGWTVPICCEKNFKSGIYAFTKRVIYYTNKKN